MYFCGYSVTLKGPNLEVIGILPIFGVISCQNLGIRPLGMTLYCVTTCCLAINFEEILSCFVLNVFLCQFSNIKRSKFGSYWHTANIWGHFLSESQYLTPWDDPILCYHLLFDHSFWRNPTMHCSKYIFVNILYH